MQEVNSNKRIAKNTIILYLRMVLVMGVTLFTSRIILKSLGIEDFGIYSIVGGSVSFFTFLSNSMALALQRFYTYELGRGNKDKIALYFNQGFWTFVLVSIIIIMLSETLGLVILKYYLDIPDDKQTIAFWVFQLSILSLVFSLLRTPYNALFIAYEKMDFFAILGIVEVLLKLGITYILLLFSSHRLIIYMILISIVTFLILEFTIYYCRRINIHEKIKFDIDKATIIKLLSFSGWTTLTSSANVLSNQGVNMVLNNVFGVFISAATGVANQVMSAVMTFLGSFQTAFNPQIVKSYASGDINKFINLLYTMSLLSFYLMMIVGIPIIIKMQPILDIWLVNVPEWTSIFSVCIILSMMVESYAGPFWMGMQAVGRIKKYQVISSIIISLNFFGAALLLYCGSSPAWAFIIKIIVSALVLGTRIVLLRKEVYFSLRKYCLSVVVRSLTVFCISFGISFFLSPYFKNLGGIILYAIISIIISALFVYLIGIDGNLRTRFNSIILSKLHIT